MAAKWIDVDGVKKLVTERKIVEAQVVELPDYLEGVSDLWSLFAALNAQSYSFQYTAPGRNTPKGGLSPFHSLSVQLPVVETVGEYGTLSQDFPVLKMKDLSEEALITEAILKITKAEADTGLRRVDRAGLTAEHKAKVAERNAAAKAKREAAEAAGTEAAGTEAAGEDDDV